MEYLLIYLNANHKENYAPVNKDFQVRRDLCEFVSELHMQTVHRVEKCDFCDYSKRDTKILKEYVYEKHPEVVMLHTMAGQINGISESLTVFGNFKMACENTLKTILENQNILKQELFVIKNNLYERKHHDLISH